MTLYSPPGILGTATGTSLALGGAAIGTDALAVTGTETHQAGVRVIQSGTTTTAANNAINNTTTGNVTVVATAGWPATGTLKTSGGNTTEYISFSVVDGVTLNLTARGVYGSVAATHAGTPTLAFAYQINAASTSVLPNFASWSDGSISTIRVTSTQLAGLFAGTNISTGFSPQDINAAPAVYVNGNLTAEFTSALTGITSTALALNSNANLTAPSSNVWQFGLTDVDTAPVAQTCRSQGALAGGTSDVAGADWTRIASPGKGTGAGGRHIWQTSPAGSTGTAVNAATNALILSGQKLNVCANTATPAAGAAGAVLLFGTTSGFGIYYGSNAPTVSAAQGSLYLRSDGSSTSTRLYINTTGSTTWTAVTTAA